MKSLCQKSREQASLPEYVPTIQPVCICDSEYKCDISGLPVGDALRFLVEHIKRPLEAEMEPDFINKTFLDIERIAAAKALFMKTRNVDEFLEGCENELAILYAKYPRNLAALQENWLAIQRLIDCRLIDVQRAFLLTIEYPETILRQEEAAGDRLKDFLKKRSALKEYLISREHAGLIQALRQHLPSVDKGTNLQDTISRQSRPVLSMHATSLRKHYFTKPPRYTLYVFPRHFAVVKDATKCEISCPIDAVRLNESNDVILVCVPHLGIVKSYKAASAAAIKEFIHQHAESLASCRLHKAPARCAHAASVPEQSAGSLYKEIVEWPEAVVPAGVDFRLGDMAARLRERKCTLFKFEDGRWNSLGRAQLCLELAPETASPFLVLRAAETGLVRLSVLVKESVIELYPPQRSFSLISKEKCMYQVRVADGDCLDHLQAVIQYIRIKSEESEEWRRYDRLPHPVLFELQECCLAMGTRDGRSRQFPAGHLTLFSSGKFEYNHQEMVIGWCCDVVPAAHPRTVVMHGALLLDGHLQWSTITVSLINDGSLFSDALKSAKFDHSIDLIRLLSSYTSSQDTHSDVRRGEMYEDDLQLSHIFTHDGSVDGDKKSLTFEDTPTGRLWTYGLI